MLLMVHDPQKDSRTPEVLYNGISFLVQSLHELFMSKDDFHS